MQRYIISGAVMAVVFALILIGYSAVLTGSEDPENTVNTEAARYQAVVHKSPLCGCCDNYVSYLRRNEVAVTVEEHNDMNPVKQENGVPHDLWSCHTTLMEGYVFEGHLPFEVLTDVLEGEEALTGSGIALPGMPSGAPGMSGGKDGPWEIYAFSDGTTTTLFREF